MIHVAQERIVHVRFFEDFFFYTFPSKIRANHSLIVILFSFHFTCKRPSTDLGMVTHSDVALRVAKAFFNLFN